MDFRNDLHPSLNAPYDLAAFAARFGNGEPVALLPGDSITNLTREAADICGRDDATLSGDDAAVLQAELHEIIQAVRAVLCPDLTGVHFDPGTRRFFAPQPADRRILPGGWEPGPSPTPTG